MRMIKKVLYIGLAFMLSFMIIGCDTEEAYPIQNKIEVFDSQTRSYDSIGLDSDCEKADVITHVITDEKIIALTIQGVGTEDSLLKLLDELDKNDIKATFFVEGQDAIKYPELVKMIFDRGHEIGNATLKNNDLKNEEKETVLNEIGKSNDLLKKVIGIAPEYLRVGHVNTTEDILLAAVTCGHNYIIGYSMVPQKDGANDAESVSDLVFKRKHRGDIILLDLNQFDNTYELITPMVEKLEEKDFHLVPVSSIIPAYEERKANILVQDEDRHKQDSTYNLIEKVDDIGPYVCLTFDDWATDDTIDEIMDVLDAYDVKATFFLRANGVELDPSLAYTMHQRGFEVANHTYSHPKLTTLTRAEIEEEVIKAHDIIAQAINAEPKRYLRPPGGEVDEKVLLACAECNYEDVIMYGVNGNDYIDTMSAQDIYESVMEDIEPGNFILLHILDGKQTSKALPLVIEGVREMGMEFVTVGQMIGDDPIY